MHGIHETPSSAGSAAESRPVGESGGRITVSVREQQDGLRFRRLLDQMSRRDREAREGGEGMIRGSMPGDADGVGICGRLADAELFLPTACCAETDAHVGGGGVVADLLPQTAAPAATAAPANAPATTITTVAEARAAVEARMERIETALRLSAYAEANAVPTKMEIALDHEVLPGSLIRIVQEAGQVRVQLIVPEDVQRARAEAVLQGLSRHLASSGLQRTTVEIHSNATGREPASVVVLKHLDDGVDEEFLLIPDDEDRRDTGA